MRRLVFVGSVVAALWAVGCAGVKQAGPKAAQEVGAVADNPLLQQWSGTHGGVPPMDRVKLEHFEPAILASMDLKRAEVEAIAANPAPATFENTLGALEDSGRVMRRVFAVYGVWAGGLATPEFQALERNMAPKLAAFSDEIYQNERLFKRIAAVYESPDKAKLTSEQQRLAWLYYTEFVRRGAKLDATAKKRLAELNQQLAKLTTQFSQNVLADEQDAVFLESAADLAGMSPSFVAAAKAAAEARKQPGRWAIANTRSAMEPFLTYSTRRDLREKVWRNYVSRGDNGDEHDNNGLIPQILQLRAERAKLLGYATHAHWAVDNAMAKTPERAMQLMEAVWAPAVARAKQEIADMQAVADKEGAKFRIEPWDYRFYAEKVRKAKYDLDQAAITPYLQMEKLREAMFWVAGELFGLAFQPIDGVPVFHPDVRVWSVSDTATGKPVGLWYFDPYAREGKQSGAWMSSYRSQELFKGEVLPIVSNNCNYLKPPGNEPVLISWADAETLFHEFGHALHGLLSQVNYPGLAGPDVDRDYVEFFSQVMENWLETPQVLNTYAVHYQSGQPIPEELVQKIQKAATFNQGFSTVEFLASALMDMKLHLAGGQPIDPDTFERETLAALGMPKEIVMRHRTPQFNHIFSGDGYSAGYYSYLWAETLTADAYEAFEEVKDPYHAPTAAKLKALFSSGNKQEPSEAYRAFRGRDADIGALMRKRGFPVPAK